MRGERLELVGRGDEGDPGQAGDFAGDPAGVFGMGVEAGADGGAAERELVERGQRGLGAADAVGDLLDVTAELLAERERHGVHEVGAADLDDIVPSVGLGGERVVQVREGGQQVVSDLFGGGDGHRAGEDVVGGLRHVDVVVGMDRGLGAAFAAERFDGDVGDDLVGVHVGLRAGAGLPDDEREVVVEFAVDDLLGGAADGVGDFGVELAELLVGGGGGVLDDAHGADDRARHALAADLEVLDRALGLCAPIAVGGDLDLAHGVGFDAHVGHDGAPCRQACGTYWLLRRWMLSTSSRTASAECLSIPCSALVSEISRMRSIPLEPSTTGTPM